MLKALEGKNPKEVFNAADRLITADSDETLNSVLNREGALRSVNPKTVAVFERTYGTTERKKTSKGKPQRRIWDEISPVGRKRSKASKG
jgi:hypothetical protein